jgi:hypothetical protein
MYKTLKRKKKKKKKKASRRINGHWLFYINQALGLFSVLLRFELLFLVSIMWMGLT